jgi:ABC-type uncharacterized transport system auxiliary subunit
VTATRIFSATSPVSALAPQPAFDALNTAFGKVATDMVIWTRDSIN